MQGDPTIRHCSARRGGDGRAETDTSLVVILVGAHGSGKSAFCNDVMATARRPWIRVCQGIIANGEQGTKSQCITIASAALKEGKSVLIDGCNLEQEQRADFVKLGEAQADVHAVVLDLPAVMQTEHEGKLQGGRAAMVVNCMLQKKELPNLSEGFSRITFCQNESDVKESVKTYSALGPSDILPAGVFGQENKEVNIQLEIIKFSKNIDKPDSDSSGRDSTTDGNFLSEAATMQVSITNTCSMELENNKEDAISSNSSSLSQRSLICDSSSNVVHTLAFPSISTADFQFDLKLASVIIVDSVSDCLKKFDNIRLVLVDINPDSKILSLVRERSASKHIDSSKFFTFVGDITQLYTRGNLRCNVIANAANWQLEPSGGGVNASIFEAAGEFFQTATKKCVDALSPGSSIVVPLPSNSPLHMRERVTHVIHVLGPNMNPQRPDCPNHDYVECCKVLHNAYSSLFADFASILKNASRNESKRLVNAISDTHDLSERPTTTWSPDSNQEIQSNSDKTKKSKGFTSNDAAKDQSIATLNENPSNLMGSATLAVDKNKRDARINWAWGAWVQAPQEIALNPEKHKDIVMEKSDDYVIIEDMYPKAKKHILVVSRLQGLDFLSDIHMEHLSLLKMMHSAGLKWAEMFLKEDASLTFRIGYHLVPLMWQFHLHVISQDFDSTHLKNKQHWNSFNTPFFCDSMDVIQEIENHGVLNINDAQSLLKVELCCNRCRSAHPNIPRLKSHIARCKIALPSSLRDNGRLVSALPKG